MMLVTGATGPVGVALCRELGQRGLAFRATSRSRHFGHMETGPLSGTTDWSRALRGVDVVVHLASPSATGPADRDLDADAYAFAAMTAGLARQAAAAGVLRFVHLSALEVHGNKSPPERPIRPTDPLAPHSPLGRIKAASEAALEALGPLAQMQMVTIRPAPLYGRDGAPALTPLVKAVTEGTRLPLAGLQTRRSLCALPNLVDVLLAAAQRPIAGVRAFLAADARPYTGPELVEAIARAHGLRARTAPTPNGLAALAMRLRGRGNPIPALAHPFEADLAATLALLGHAPRFGLDDMLRRPPALPVQ